MPLLEFEIASLHPFNQYLLDNCETIRKYYDDNFIKGFDPDALVIEAMDYYLDSSPFNDEKLALIINWTHFIHRQSSKKQVRQAIENGDKRTFYLITFTSDPNKTEEENMLNITRYRQSHFKKYKHVYVAEKDSADSGKYHQHVLIECPLRVVHTKQNLKPANYYKGNINVQRVSSTKSSINNILSYLSKENSPKGDLDYFLHLQF